jgi:hypothetical protein
VNPLIGNVILIHPPVIEGETVDAIHGACASIWATAHRSILSKVKVPIVVELHEDLLVSHRERMMPLFLLQVNNTIF